MEFCIGTTAKIDAVGLVKQAEDVGASHFGVGEGPLLFSDPYQYLALAARDTSTIKLGTWVTNPLTRIAPVTANSIATLNALAPGRTFLGHRYREQRAAFDGQPAGDPQELDSALTVIRGLLAGERVEHRRGSGRTARSSSWTPTALVQLRRPGRGVDVRRRPEGPRARRQARRLHDLLPRARTPDMIGVVRRELDKAVADAGRGAGLGQARRPVLVLPAAPRRDLGRRGRRGLRLRPDQLLHHQRRAS